MNSMAKLWLALALAALCVSGALSQAAAPAAGDAAAAAPAAGGAAAAAPAAGGGCRAKVGKLTDYGAVGDGKTSNTKAFRDAMTKLGEGSMLVVPAGKWLTGPFNITSNHFTLFLEKDATILATQDMTEWEIIEPLPSYGRGRDVPGGRFMNFIMATKLDDIVITGNNGTIDGQGEMWWTKYRADQLKNTRGYLLELMYCSNVIVSNITLQNSPSWTVHPVYSKNLIFSGVTILAPTDSANTDGIDPDSSQDVLIENCFIVSGDDCVAIKSGWDQYGNKFNMPSQRIVIKGMTCISPTSAVIALGSEMSGGITDVWAEDITAINSESGVRIKSAVGRGAFVKNIYVKGFKMHTMKWVFWMTGSYGQHADDSWDPKALPKVDNIHFSDVDAENVTMMAKLEGITSAPYTGTCLSNIKAVVNQSEKPVWNCTDVSGVASNVTPKQCDALKDSGGQACQFPAYTLPTVTSPCKV